MFSKKQYTPSIDSQIFLPETPPLYINLKKKPNNTPSPQRNTQLSRNNTPLHKETIIVHKQYPLAGKKHIIVRKQYPLAVKKHIIVRKQYPLAGKKHIIVRKQYPLAGKKHIITLISHRRDVYDGEIFPRQKSFFYFWRKIYMRTLLALCLLGAIFSSCFSHRKPNPDILPKHISQMPLRKPSEENFLETEAKNLRLLNDSIKSVALSIRCTDSEEWRITPLGSKPCGGPKEYIAYHKNVEQEIIPLVQDYTRREAHYNILAGLTSDCALVPQPTNVACQNGIPVLLNKNETPSP